MKWQYDIGYHRITIPGVILYFALIAALLVFYP